MLLDLTHTSHTRARTGVQRLARALWKELGAGAVPICHDPYAGRWRPLQGWELDRLGAESAGNKRGARWPLAARLRGRIARRRSPAGPALADPGPVRGLLEPEIFSPATAAALPALFAQAPRPRVAVFCDAIALQYPELTPPKTVARFPAYLRELLGFDGVAAISADSRDALTDYWRWLGLAAVPPVIALPLGVDLPAAPADAPAPSPGAGRPTVLSVGSIEGRKNHLALLEACEKLWSGGLDFELRLIGLAQAQTGSAALERIAALQRAGRPLRYDGAVDEAALDAAYQACRFTVYPSLLEGFGLPVIESLVRGKPCVCSGRGALGETSRGGGCLPLDRKDPESLAAAIGELLRRPQLLARLAAEARNRRFKSWSAYARELSDWMGRLALDLL